MQCPYYVHKALVKLFDLPEEKIRIIQTETGGGFGGKEEYPSLIAGHAALLPWKSGKPVEIIYHRADITKPRSRKTANCSRWRSISRSTVVLIARSRPSCFHAGRFTLLVHISVRTSGFTAGQWRRTCRRTGRSAVSARRKASSRSSDTWIKSLRQLA